MSLKFKEAAHTRDKVCEAEKKRIAKLYEEWAKEIGEKAAYLQKQGSKSAAWQATQLLTLQKQAKQQAKEVSKQISKGLKQSLYVVADGVVKNNTALLKSLGFDLAANVNLVSVPTKVVENIVHGRIYEGGWNLSKAIWSDNEKTLSDIYTLVAKGRVQNLSAYEIAKMLESYVNPNRAKQWNWKMEDGRYIHKRKVDYNAQRLARTLTQHAYQQSVIESTRDNPFVQYIIWIANGSRACPLCQDRDGQRYRIDNLPMDHPNGMCTMEPDIDMNKTVNQLAAWYNADDGTFPDIDAFAKQFGYDPSKPTTFSVKDNVALANIEKTLGTSQAKTFNYWYTKLNAEQKAYAKNLKDKSKLTWQQWYEKYIYKGKPLANEATKATAAKKAVKEVVEDIDLESLMKLFGNQGTKAMLAEEKKMLAKLTQKEISALKMYTGSSYRQINGYLRLRASGMSYKDAVAKSLISEKQLEAIKYLDSAFSKLRTTKDMALRRGTDLGDLAGFLDGDFRVNKNKLASMSVEELNKMFKGKVGTYHGFTSTSSNFEKGFSGSVEIIIKAPKGSKASSIMSISQYGTDEGETLLRAGTKVRIIKIEKSDGHYDSRIRVFMQIVE